MYSITSLIHPQRHIFQGSIEQVAYEGDSGHFLLLTESSGDKSPGQVAEVTNFSGNIVYANGRRLFGTPLNPPISTMFRRGAVGFHPDDQRLVYGTVAASAAPTLEDAFDANGRIEGRVPVTHWGAAYWIPLAMRPLADDDQETRNARVSAMNTEVKYQKTLTVLTDEASRREWLNDYREVIEEMSDISIPRQVFDFHVSTTAYLYLSQMGQPEAQRAIETEARGVVDGLRERGAAVATHGLFYGLNVQAVALATSAQVMTVDTEDVKPDEYSVRDALRRVMGDRMYREHADERSAHPYLNHLQFNGAPQPF